MWSLVQEDPMCHGESKPLSHSCEACAPERPGATASGNHVLQSLGSAPRDAAAMRDPHPTAREQPPLAATREKPALQRRPSTAENNEVINLIKKVTAHGTGCCCFLCFGVLLGRTTAVASNCLDASPVEYQYCHAIRNQ